MRAVFGVLGLVIVVAIVGMLAKKQLTALAPPAAGVRLGRRRPRTGAATASAADAPGGGGGHAGSRGRCPTTRSRRVR